MSSAKAIIGLVLILSLSGSVCAQAVAASEKEQQRQRWRRQAIDTIKQVAAETSTWSDKETAVQALTDAADSIWKYDTDLGAEWLSKAWSLTDGLASTATDEKLKDFFSTSVQSRLRTRVLSVARKHDQKLAQTFVEQLQVDNDNKEKSRGVFDDRTVRSEQLLTLAQQILDSNPHEAFRLAQTSLADGISFKLQNILTGLRKKDVALANQLFDLALARFKLSQPEPSEAQVLAGYLFQSGITFGAGGNGTTMVVLNPAHQSLPAVAAKEPLRAKNFLSAVYELLLSRPLPEETPESRIKAQSLLLLGNRLVVPYSTYAPDLVPSVRSFLANLERIGRTDSTLSQNVTRSSSANDAKSPSFRTAEESYEKAIAELVEIADREKNPAFKNIAYIRAAVATKPHDYSRGKSIADKVDDLELRTETLSFVYYRGALFFVRQSDLDNAADLVPRISDVLRRNVVRIAFAHSLLEAKPNRKNERASQLNRQRAFDHLNDLGNDLRKTDSSIGVAKLMLGRTALLARLDHTQAVAALEEAMQVIDKLDKMNLQDGAVPTLGLSAVPSSGATVEKPSVGCSLRSAVEELVESDFDLVLSIVAKLRQRETNAVARLEVARHYLEKTDSPTVNPR